MSENKPPYITKPRTYTDDYFKNRVEQGRIKEALWMAFPVNIQYFNAVIALTEMLQRLVQEAYSDDVMRKPPIEPVADNVSGKGPEWDLDMAEDD